MNQLLLDDLDYQKPQKAGFWLRLRATLLDGIILLIFTAFYTLFLLMASYGIPAITMSTGSIVLGTIYFLYNPLMESGKSQGSLGKQVFNLKVVDKEEKSLSFGYALLRMVAKLLSSVLFFAGFIMIGWSDKKEGLHDMIVGTVVIRTPKD